MEDETYKIRVVSMIRSDRDTSHHMYKIRSVDKDKIKILAFIIKTSCLRRCICIC